MSVIILGKTHKPESCDKCIYHRHWGECVKQRGVGIDSYELYKRCPIYSLPDDVKVQDVVDAVIQIRETRKGKEN